MPRSILWVLAVLAAAAVVVLVVILVRRRRTEHGSWSTGDYVVLLGIVLAFLATVIGLLAAARSDEESDEVTAFRTDVQAACRALAAHNQANPIVALVGASGTVPRQEVIDTMNRYLDAGAAILDSIWARPVPDELADDARAAQDAAAVVLFVERSDINALAVELPDPVSPIQVARDHQAKALDDAGSYTMFEAAMSKLAGEDCRPATPSG